MEVDFNNLRRQTANNFNKLVDRLNAAIIKNDEQHAKPNGWIWSTNIKNHVLIDAEEIETVIDNLRSNIVVLCCCSSEGEENFAEVEMDRFATFNSDEDED